MTPKKSIILCHILGLNLKMFLSDCFLYFTCTLDIGWEDSCENMIGPVWSLLKTPSGPPNWLLLKPKIPPPPPPPRALIYLKMLHVWPINVKTGIIKLFPLVVHICLHCDEVCICWHFGAPGTPVILCKLPNMTPRKMEARFFIYVHYFNFKRFLCMIAWASIFDMWKLLLR